MLPACTPTRVIFAWILLVLGSLTALPLRAQNETPKPTLTLLPFVVADGSGAGTDPAKAACPATAAEVTNVTPEGQAAVISGIAGELGKKLGDKYQVVSGTAGASAEGALVLSGCFTEMNGGNATKRLIGAGMGSSLLRVRVQLVRMSEGKAVPVTEFDEVSKGRNFGVGSGMLINAMRAKRTSTAGDADNLADRIVKDLQKGK